jgi:hypothetical protein
MCARAIPIPRRDPARRVSTTKRGLLPGAPVPTRTALAPVCLDQLAGHTTGQPEPTRRGPLNRLLVSLGLRSDRGRTVNALRARAPG